VLAKVPVHTLSHNNKATIRQDYLLTWIKSDR